MMFPIIAISLKAKGVWQNREEKVNLAPYDCDCRSRGKHWIKLNGNSDLLTIVTIIFGLLESMLITSLFHDEGGTTGFELKLDRSS